MNIKELLEEYVDSAKAGKYTFSVHKNPSMREVREILKEFSNRNEVRYIVDLKTKDVYVFNATFLHNRAAELLNFQYEMEDVVDDRWIYGVGDYNLKTGKIDNKEVWASLNKKIPKWLTKFFEGR